MFQYDFGNLNQTAAESALSPEAPIVDVDTTTTETEGAG